MASENDHIDESCDLPGIHPEAVARARAGLPHRECIEGAAEILKICADPTRMKMLLALRMGELCVCDVAAVADISESAASHQLRLLRAHKIVRFRKAGRVAYYALADDHVSTLLRVATEHAHEDHAGGHAADRSGDTAGAPSLAAGR